MRWNIWRVAYKSEKELAEKDPANPSILKEEIVESGYTNWSVARARARKLYREQEGKCGFPVREEGYNPYPDIDQETGMVIDPDPAYWDSGFYIDLEEDADFVDGIAAIQAGVDTDDPYGPNLDDDDFDW